MQFTLLPFQADASDTVGQRLDRALRSWREDREPSALCLSAITGAGKTVIATSVIETIMRTQTDRRVLFLWVTDDPALNRQTAKKMLDASSQLNPADVVVIDESFDEEMLAAGKVYLLNIQKLSASSGLVKPSEKRTHSLWDALAATAQASDRDLVLIADEAHRGMKEPGDRATILQQLISGRYRTGQNAPAPVVWGISATPERFLKTMNELGTHTVLRTVEVTNDDVRASGLLKLQIVLDRPQEKAPTTTLREATITLAQVSRDWAAYCAAESEPVVRPAMVVQVPNKASDTTLRELLNVIESTWVDGGQPALSPDAVVNVLAEHNDLTIGGRTVRYLSPEQVSADPDAIVVIAKEAVTTGWDCPRAEVLFSLRSANDATHIAQLIGRIVRAPLTRTIDGDTSLNSVYAYLPEFHAQTLEKVISKISGSDGDTETGVEVVVGTVDLTRNVDVPDGALSLLNSLPSWAAPSKPKPVMERLVKLAGLLTEDGIVEDAGKKATAILNGVLSAEAARDADELESARQSVEKTSLARVTVDLTTNETVSTTRTVATDDTGLDAAFAQARKALPQGIAEAHVKWLLRDNHNPSEEDIQHARVTVSALARMKGAVDAVMASAEQQIGDLLNSSRQSIAVLPEGRRAQYEAVKASGSSPYETTLEIPDKSSAAVGKIVDKKVGAYPTKIKHVLADAKKNYPVSLNGWEERTLARELENKNCVAWYRNPSRASGSALRIAYTSGGAWESMQPDFLFVYEAGDEFRPVIVDPHGVHLGDSLGKLVGLADYAQTYGDKYARIEAVGVETESKDAKLIYLDMLDPSVRDAVRAWTDPKVAGLYAAHGKPYEA